MANSLLVALAIASEKDFGGVMCPNKIPKYFYKDTMGYPTVDKSAFSVGDYCPLSRMLDLWQLSCSPA